MNKKILTAATTLVFAAVAVAGSTYAWFTLNQTATVEQLDVNVTAGDGLYVSLTGDEGTFSDSINPRSLLAENFKFIPVTTSDGESFVDRKGEDVGAANADGGYVSFDVYLRSKSELPIYLSSASVTSVASSLTLNVPVNEQIGAWAASEVTYTGTPAETTTLTTRASNATRFSVLGGTTDKIFDLADDDGFGERVAPTNSTGDPVADWTWGTGYNRAFEYLKRVSPNDLTDATFAGTTAAIVDEIPAVDGVAIVTLASVGSATFENGDDDKVWTDSDWYAEKLTVKIWLEGWDADCFDVLFNDTVTINMVFKGQI